MEDISKYPFSANNERLLQNDKNLNKILKPLQVK